MHKYAQIAADTAPDGVNGTRQIVTVAAQETQSATEGVVEGDPSRQASGRIQPGNRKEPGYEQKHGQEVPGGGDSRDGGSCRDSEKIRVCYYGRRHEGTESLNT